MTNSIFKTKEQYLTFRAVWATSVNFAKTQRKLPKHRRLLKASHHVLYNILRGKPFDRGFTPITNANKLKNGMHINFGLYNAMHDLKNLQSSAKQLVKGASLSDWWAGEFTEFMRVFGNTVTVETLANLDFPKIEALYSTFGKSKKVANEIISGEFKPTNFKQVYDVLASYQ